MASVCEKAEYGEGVDPRLPVSIGGVPRMWAVYLRHYG